MRKKTIKAKIASLLSASMALAMLAPAMPAQAATQGTLVFDFYENASDSLTGPAASYQIVMEGNVGDTIDTDSTSSTFSGLNVFGGRTGLPWQTGISASNVAEFAVPTSGANIGKHEGNVKGKSWEGTGAGGLDLKGYKIKEFRAAKGLGDFPRAGLDVNTIQNVTYYATLESNGQDAMTIDELHVPDASTAYVPSLSATSTGPLNGPHKVLESVQAVPYSIPGYAVTNVTLTGDGSAKALSYMGGSIPASKFISFKTSNKNVAIKYEYGIDNSVFTVKVVDKVWQNDAAPGSFSHSSNTVKSQNNRTSANVTGQVLTRLNDNGARKITANGNYVDITGTAALPSRYVLDPSEPVTISYDKGTPDSSTGKFTQNGGDISGGNPAIPTLIPAADSGSDYTKISVGAAPEYVINGQLPNQNVTITYNYYENPNYYTVIDLNYIDKEGNSVVDKILQEHPGLLTDIATVVPPAAPAVGVPYTDGTNVYMRVNVSQKDYQIPVPALNDYISDVSNPTKLPSVDTEDALKWNASYRYISTGTSTAPTAATEGWNAGSHAYYGVTIDKDGDGNADTPTTSGKLAVMYTLDPDKVASVVAVGIGTGQLIVDDGLATEHEYGTDASDVARLSRQNITASDYSLTVNESNLPTPKPAMGYKFGGWQYNGTTITAWPYVINNIPRTTTSVLIRGIFEKDTDKWNTYHLAAGNTHVQLLAGDKAEVANTDTSGVPRGSILFNELDAYTQTATGGVSVDAGYTLEWRNQMGALISATDNIAGLNGQTFTAFAVSTSPEATYTPNVTAELDSSGAPVIAVDALAPAPMDSRLNYIVTDAAGNVVAVLTGVSVMTNGGNITGNFLTPGNTYKIATALSTEPVSVGSPLPNSPGISAPTTATVPVAPTPIVTEDPANQGMASITISPTAPNTEYALVDDAGNEVYPFSAPTGNTITFGNLNPGKVYNVVPRPVGSNDSPAARQAAGASLPVNTANLGLSVSSFDVTIVEGNYDAPDNFKIKGRQESDASKLKGLSKGDAVEIVAKPIDKNSNMFKGWNVISGGVTPQSGIRITFTMPNKPVVLQPMYDDGIDWQADDYNDNIQSNKNVGVQKPELSGVSATDKFKIVIDKDSVPASVKTMIGSTLDDAYHDVFMLKVRVMRQPGGTGNWEEYIPASGELDLNTFIETGALVSTREYKLHKLASSSNAVEEVHVDEFASSDHSNYQGQFNINLKAGSSYIFGYTTPLTYKIKVRDNRDNDLITTLTLKSTEAVKDKKSLYASRIVSDYVDNNGITWHYEGLSTDKDTYTAYDDTSKVTADGTIYVFYSNDKSERAKAESDLKSAVNYSRADLKSYDAPSQALLTAKLDALQALLDKTNRKASTAELKAALDELNKLLATLKRTERGGGGGSRGGGSGSGGSGNKGTTGNPVKVGYDGTWELLNPEEAKNNLDASRWVFNLRTGGRITGWAYLSYTYDGQTKSSWYHFGTDNKMDSGWFFDGANNKWYYLSMEHNGFFGEMKTGWILDAGRWYYLNPSSGEMLTGWVSIGNEFYYLNTSPGQAGKPYGAMYQSEKTPDGYNVNERGVWY